MIGNTLALPRWSRLNWSGQLRRCFSGFGFAASVSLALLVLWSLEPVLWNLPKLGALQAVNMFAASAWSLLCNLLPNTLMFLVALNLAPPAGVRRIAWFIIAPLLMAGWSTILGLIQGAQFDIPVTLECLLYAALFSAAMAYRNSAQRTASSLVKKSLESSALETEVKRAQLQLLRAQVEPHFLFNTLAALRTLSRVDRLAAIEMLDNLMRYFAEALPNLKRDESSLAEEMKLIDAYLRIHQIRFGARLGYELEVPADLATLRVPTMVLLTLVENAVKHGIGPCVEGGFVRVSATLERATLTLKVADSGRGMTAHQGGGSGLANVRRRLEILYGDAGGLSLTRAESRGVVATVSIPVPTHMIA
jgi:signal transduction histidine kinase